MQNYWLKMVTFLKDVRAELKKVSWPSRAGVMSSTKVVILLSVVLGVYVGALDALFKGLVGYIFRIR
ncbi:MAG: preprotein translocase subunit SecE [Candidatus Wallbacteria bacterium]|nr:preprotein translocase subunit SecE [Candidatus Wallbacteria bacterium]